MPQMRRRTAAAWVVLLLVFCAGCANDLNAPHPHLVPVWREYLEMPDQRALAIAGDPRRGRWVTAASGGHATKTAAKEDALRQCRVRRKIRRLQPACVLYALGNQIVWHGP